MWDFSIGKSMGLMARTLPFILLRVAVYFGITLAYILVTGTGAGIGWGVGALGDGGFQATTTFWGGVVGFGIVAAVMYWVREYILYMVKAGHIAVMVELLDGKPIPEGRSQIGHASAVVKELPLPLLRLLRKDYEVIALDWPAHGESDGRITNMREWLVTLRALSAAFGPWHAVVGHSLGAFCAACATRNDMPQFGPPLRTENLVLLAPPENSIDMLRLFSRVLNISRAVQDRMQRRFDGILGAEFGDFSLARILQKYEGRLLVVHDEDDRRVPFEGFERMRNALPGQAFMTTRGLGHRKILEDRTVLERIAGFIEPGVAETPRKQRAS
jgi:hypothetical protein